MGNKAGNKRRENLGYQYNVYEEVSHYPKTSDLGERVNIFLTELTKQSAVLRITVGESAEENVYFGADKLKCLLSHTQYKTVIADLISRGIVESYVYKNIYDVEVYTFRPVFYKPIATGIQIRNLKVRNGVRRYLGILDEKIEDNVHKWLRPALIDTEIKITEKEFYSDLPDKYSRYVRDKRLKGEEPRSLASYTADLETTFYSIRRFQQLNRSRRAGWVSQDDFSGRVYNIATGVPRWVRSYLTIGGERLAELDMCSSHAVLLWNVCPRTDYVKFLYEVTSQEIDIYDSYGEKIGIRDRKEVKFRFLRSLYGRKSSKYYREFKRVFPEAGRILDKIKSEDNPKNPSCKTKGKHTNLAFKLLNLEVRYFKKVWEALYIAGIPFLSIHDAILVPLSRLSEARDIMTGILRREIPIVETKTVFY